MFRFEVQRLIAACLLLSCASIGWAGGAGVAVGATEVTQIMNNVELLKVATDGAMTAQKTVQAYMTQLQQYQTQLQNLQRLEGIPAGLVGDASKAVSDLLRYKQALSSLTGSLEQQSSFMGQRIAEARLGGKGWSAYVQRIAAEASAGHRQSVERLKYEQSVLEQVQQDYQFARNLQEQIPATVGQQQSLQLMNAQMNRVVTQNAKLLEVMSISIGKQARDEQREAEAKAKALADQELLRQRSHNIQERQRAFGDLPQ